MHAPIKIPKHFNAKIEQALEPDETVQWLGMPAMRAFTITTALGFVVGILALLFAVTFFVVGLEKWNDTGFLVTSLIFGAVLLLVGLRMFGSPFFRYRKATQFLYLVTNHRAILLSRKRSAKVQGCLIEKIHHIACEEKRNGLGDLMIWIEPVNIQGVIFPGAVVCFSRIQYPEAVEQLIRKLAAKKGQSRLLDHKNDFAEPVEELEPIEELEPVERLSYDSAQEWIDFCHDNPVLLQENGETYAMLSRHEQETLCAELKQDEQIKWLDVPFKKRAFTPMTTLLLILGIPMVLLGLLMFGMVISHIDESVAGCVVVFFLGITFLGLGLFAVMSPSRTFKRNFTMLYAITNQRVIAFDFRWVGQKESWPLEKLQEVHLWQNRNGLGSLGFSGLYSSGFEPNHHVAAPGFRLIKNPLRVRYLLKELAGSPIL